ncbi:MULTISPECIES: aldo/keto reductase [unclassified Acinetobacter]|jgi:aryl-alcohol dehydrogenase-like predicted oxidoreductase|uniref:aldo/keto reductase n=1 Tax=unclassified Acinetobacter TaxID=196816 RepID=UPI000A33716B|nr:aldo/keto reductase [Acinetobacter sp. ANC 4218]OTG72245.1 oxidoreductase [Acinetobacter sp. ANC 4218]
MNYQLFGQTGLNVSQIALGTGNFGTGWGYGSSPEDAKLVLDAYLDVGGNFIDTADVYQFGQSEQILGDLLQGIRHEVVLATKFSDGASLDTNQLHKGNSRKAMLYSVEQSLRRLKTDYIDLYWVHHPDNVTPSEEILRGLEDLARTGKILYAGLSNFPAWRLSRAATIAELKNTVPIAAAQFQHSLVCREPEADLIPASQALGLGMVTWSPLGGGMLTGKYRQGEKGREEGFGGKVFQQENSIQRTAILDAVLSIAAELNVSADQVAIAWAGTHGTIPIIGPKSLQQAESNLHAIDVVLSPDQIQLLDSVSQITTSDQKRLPILNIDVKHKAIIA